VLGWPRGTVKSRLHRALGRLREALPEKEVRR
jgi:DNA-directed RNA polymerase specialized sigma24 family protein